MPCASTAIVVGAAASAVPLKAGPRGATRLAHGAAAWPAAAEQLLLGFSPAARKSSSVLLHPTTALPLADMSPALQA